MLSVRAEYLGILCDRLPSEKQEAVLSLFKALSMNTVEKENIQQMRQTPDLTPIQRLFSTLYEVIWSRQEKKAFNPEQGPH